MNNALRLLAENVIMDCEADEACMDEVLDLIKMKRQIQKAKAIHPYKVYHTEKSGWFTTVDDDTAPKGKRKIRKKDELDLWDALAKWYLDNADKNITFEELYSKWLAWKTTPNNPENIKRLKKEWAAYYEKEPLSQKLLQKKFSKITSLDLREWAESLMIKHHPDKKKFSRMFTIVNQMYEYAADEDRLIVEVNLWEKARKKIRKELFAPTPVPSDESQVFTDDERRQIKRMVYDDLEKYQKQATSAGLQILFLFETGLRIGECCGLKWSDIRKDRLYICRQADNNGVKEKTKSETSYRDIPLTQEALRILESVREYNEAHNFNAEWIFQSDNPAYDYRLSYNAADRKLRKLCARLDTVVKSPHKCRKTAISILLDSPLLNARTAQKFAGHKHLSTTYDFYSFERKSKEEQAEAINLALAL